MKRLYTRKTAFISMLLLLMNFISCKKDEQKLIQSVMSTDVNYVFKPMETSLKQNKRATSSTSGSYREYCDGAITYQFSFNHYPTMNTEEFKNKFVNQLNNVLFFEESGHFSSTRTTVTYQDSDGFLYQRMKDYIIKAFDLTVSELGYSMWDPLAPSLAVDGIRSVNNGKLCRQVWVEAPIIFPGFGTGLDQSGTGGDYTGESGHRPTILIDNIQDPCVKNILVNTVFNGLKGRIQDILQALNQDAKVELTFRDVPYLPNNKDGETSGSFTTLNGVKTFSGEIKLNMDHLTNASKEYISGVIIHEAIHGYFRVQEGSDERINGLDHITISENYIYPMALFLSQMYNISLVDAAAIEWRGVPETEAFKNAQEFRVGFGLESVIVSKEDMVQTGVQYYINQKGKPRCN